MNIFIGFIGELIGTNIFIGELIGTMLLVLLGDGVVANVQLEKSKGQNSGWIVIAAGWGFAVAVGVYVAGWASGGHLNPAVTIGMAVLGKLPVAQVPVYLVAQFLGGFLGAVLVWLAYLPHWSQTADPPPSWPSSARCRPSVSPWPTSSAKSLVLRCCSSVCSASSTGKNTSVAVSVRARWVS